MKGKTTCKFDALLGRTTTVTQEDKRRVRHAMVNEFRSLLDEGYFVQMRAAESRQKGWPRVWLRAKPKAVKKAVKKAWKKDSRRLC